MRVLPAVLIVLAACGGTPATTSTTPRVEPAPPPAGEEGQPAGEEGPPAGGEAVDTAVCANRTEMFGPFALDEAQAQRRYGTNARTFADAPTTKDRAIEVCGVPASRQWLRGTACADGSPAKQNGRSGSVGPGGRCGAIIDLYSVTCPEGNHDVYIDIYMCGPGESMR
ncbi:MAG TPA: hypothetical protein VK932_02765 [Kofleriaceae bacterium]|nr:hypothetical protein [Kofleriaceae bacterium]